MTLPTQRSAPSGGPDTGGWRILEAVNRVDDSVRNLATDMAGRFDRLDERFMPRREITARLDDSLRDRGDLRSMIERVKTRHETDVTRIETDAEAAETRRQTADTAAVRDRRTTRRWLVTTALTAVGAATGVIATHFH